MKRDPSKTWALVINGARCRILRGILPSASAGLAELVLKSEARNLREMLSGNPGGTFAPTRGSRRLAVEHTSDPVAEDQREFTGQVIALLESHRRAGDFDRLAIFAEHDMLGHLRQMMPRALAGLVIREVPNNLLYLSAAELAEAVSTALRDGTDSS